MRAEELRRTVSVLRKVIGRSDEIFHFVAFGDGYIGATDGCLKAVRTGFGVRAGGVLVPLEALWSFLKRSSGDVEMWFSRDDLVLESGSARLIVRNPKRSRMDVHVGFSGDADVRELRKGLDFVSRPLEDDESPELHALGGGDVLIVGKTPGISAAALIEASVSVKGGLSIPYQSARRFVKSLEGFEGHASVSVGNDSFSVSVSDWVFSVCGERVRSSVSVPKPFDGTVIELKAVLKALEMASEILKTGFLYITGDRMGIRGKTGGIEASDEVRLERDSGLKIEAEVPFRKLRSYLSNMGGRYVIVGLERGILKMSDTKFRRFVFLRGRKL